LFIFVPDQRAPVVFTDRKYRSKLCKQPQDEERRDGTSPIIAAAWYWHDWIKKDYDWLAGLLLAGHHIECFCLMYLIKRLSGKLGESPTDSLSSRGLELYLYNRFILIQADRF
jgi:hypothetical protein